MYAIKNMHPTTSPKQVHAFLGLVVYYRKFIKNIVKIAKPFNTTDTPASQIQLDTNQPQSLSAAQGIHYSTTHITLP